MIVRPPTVSPGHQRRLKRTITRLLDRAHEDAVNVTLASIRTIITDGGTIAPPSLPSLAGDVIGSIIANTIAKIKGIAVSGVAPVGGQVLVFNGDTEQIEWGAPGDASGEVIDYSTLINEATTPAGATFSASSTATGQLPAFAADNDDSTYWLTSGVVYPGDPSAGSWWRTDLGSAKTITYYRLVQPAQGAYRSASSKLQSSTDDSTWTDRETFGIYGDSGLLALDAPVTARYWRLLGVTHSPLASLGSNYFGMATVALYSGVPTIQAPGHTIQDEGTGVLQRTALNFVGDGVAVTDTGGKTTVTIPGGGGHTIEDEGTSLTARTSLNFVGAGVTTTDAGGKTVVTIPGGGGGGSGARWEVLLLDGVPLTLGDDWVYLSMED